MIFNKRPQESSSPEDSASMHPGPDAVAGERGAPSIARALSLQSRVSNALAIGLVSVLGLGLLIWYYAQTLSSPARAQDQAKAAARVQAQGDMVLPPIGPIDPPTPVSSAAAAILGPAPEEPPPDSVPDAWVRPAVELQPQHPAYMSSVPAAPSPAELALARKLSGPVVANHSNGSGPVSAMAVTAPEMDGAMGSPEAPSAGDSAIGALLKPTVMPAARARVLPTQRLLLAKGAFLDCTLETAIDSTLPGMTTCVTATDTFGVDGSVVLLERGTKLIGETRGQVQQGSARIFVLWSEARTPTGVVIPLASPGTDELGRSGLQGQVNRHFFDRFGAAILISVIDGAIQSEVQSRSNGGGTVIYDPSTSRDVMTEVLKSTVNIPPTVTKHNGDRIQVLVARDLDFRSVYELRPTALAR